MFPKTRQEIFDGTVNHLRKQGVKSYDLISTRCFYRGPNGTKCAVGWAIPDELYDPAIECAGTVDGLVKLDKKFKDFKDHESLWFKLQKIHDRVDINNWEDAFADCAKNLKLIYTPPGKND